MLSQMAITLWDHLGLGPLFFRISQRFEKLFEFLEILPEFEGFQKFGAQFHLSPAEGN